MALVADRPEETRRRLFWLRWSSFAPKLKEKWSIAIGGSVLAASLILVILWFVLPNSEITSFNPDDIKDNFYDMILATQTKNAENFQLWYKSNIILHTILIVSALLATILAALTTAENANRIRKWTVLVTASTASLASVQTTFNLKENIETFIVSADSLNKLEYEYLVERHPYLPTLSQNLASGASVPRELLLIQRQFGERLSGISNTRMRAWANVGQKPVPPDRGWSDGRQDRRDTGSAVSQTR